MVKRAYRPRFRRGFRRKRNKGTWFPVNGDVWTGEGSEYYDATANAWVPGVPVARNEGPYNLVFPITQDYTFNAAKFDSTNPNDNPSLRDYVEGQDYILNSLVGNCFVNCRRGIGQSPTTTYDQTRIWPYIQVTAGFFVARASDADPSLPDLTKDEVDPLCGLNIQDPWIWRRMWMLGNPNAGELQKVGTVGGTVDVYTEPRPLITENWQYPSIAGPHFQTKSRRRVRREERLWFSISAIGWNGDAIDVAGGTSEQPGFMFSLDVRLFGKMVKGRNASTF